jgi:nucleoside-diphosphate-sugar epimerase
VLVSALKHANDTVKRVVITSSCSAVLTEDPGHAHTFTEGDWNEQSVKDVQEKGREANNIDKYHASKTLAERSAWTFFEENKDQAKFDIVAINPPYVFGPVLHDVKRGEDLNTSMLNWWNTVIKFDKDPEFLATYRCVSQLYLLCYCCCTQRMFSNAWVDVRDVADAHVKSLQKDEAGSERIIVCGGSWTWQDFGVFFTTYHLL